MKNYTITVKKAKPAVEAAPKAEAPVAAPKAEVSV